MFKSTFKKFILAIIISISSIGSLIAQPFSITAYIDSSVIKTTDYSTLLSVSYSGEGYRWMFDRRIDDWAYLNALLFDVIFDDGIQMEFQINPEFDLVNATAEAEKYAFILGQLPICLRSEVAKVWIHQGAESFGGGFNGLLIHVGTSPMYENLGILEEVLFHEITHTALDPQFSASEGWVNAQALDNSFISSYGGASPEVEDLAESFLTWLMVRQCERRISTVDSVAIAEVIPNRLAFFDEQQFDLYPICINALELDVDNLKKNDLVIYPNPTNANINVLVPNELIGQQYVLMDSYGRIVEIGILSTKNVKISIKNSGLYFLSFSDNNQIFKIIRE